MTLVAVIGILVGVNLLVRYGPANAGLVLGPFVAVMLVVLARWSGLTWDDLGLARRSWRKGVAYAAVGIATVAVGYGVAAVLPVTRVAFLDARYHLRPGPALVTALFVIPLSTVLLEEVAFRGVLLGLVRRHRGTAWAMGTSSALFGLWHILPSLRLGVANQAVAMIVGHGGYARVVVVTAVVGFTALAGLGFCELRRRSGSMFASVGLHWATNGLGVMAATVLWATAHHG
jgi:membrane protease YdiL (CAAX protease family)